MLPRLKSGRDHTSTYLFIPSQTDMYYLHLPTYIHIDQDTYYLPSDNVSMPKARGALAPQ